MVMLLARRVFGGAGIPAVEAEFPDGIPAGGGDTQPTRLQGVGHVPDAIQHLVLRRDRAVVLMTVQNVVLSATIETKESRKYSFS